MATMKVAQVKSAGGDFKIVDIPIPEPGWGQVRIKVEACGVCHTDVLVKEGLAPIAYPRVPGHEVVGTIAALGEGVKEWSEGERVGVGWHGGHCFICRPCRRGDFIHCEHLLMTGVSYDGGYAEYMVAPHEALARVPASLKSVDAAPLLCAGITTFNALRNSKAKAGALVAVQGIGGLGHLGVQYANKLGFHTIAISSGKDKEELARQLGAQGYIDTSLSDAAQELQKLGGASVILATATNNKATAKLIDGLGPDGEILLVAAVGEPAELMLNMLISKSRAIHGWASGTALNSEDTLDFSALTGTLPMVEVFPLEQVATAYERMMTGKARFRPVLQMAQ